MCEHEQLLCRIHLAVSGSKASRCWSLFSHERGCRNSPLEMFGSTPTRGYAHELVPGESVRHPCTSRLQVCVYARHANDSVRRAFSNSSSLVRRGATCYLPPSRRVGQSLHRRQYILGAIRSECARVSELSIEAEPTSSFRVATNSRMLHATFYADGENAL